MKVLLGAKWPERRPLSKRTCPPPWLRQRTSPRLHRGCSFLPQPEFAGFIWSAPGFTFQCADEAERDAHSDALE